MSPERESKILARMPETVWQQIASIPHPGERENICKALSELLKHRLKKEGVKIEKVFPPRAKSLDRIEEKVKIRKTEAPLRDIYGVRFITNYPDRQKLAKIIQSAFPLTPAKFPDGMPSIRDYADPKIKEFVKKNFNPRISERHSALHVNVVFLRPGETFYDIAEIQVLTSEEMRIFEETRGEYENGKS